MTRHAWWFLAGLVLSGAIVIGCGATTPSALPASDAASVLPDLTPPASSPTPVPGTSTGAAEGMFHAEFVDADGGRELPVVLQDQTGLVVGIEARRPDDGRVADGISNAAGRPNVLIYAWTGGACDTLTSLTFERVGAGFRLTNTTKTTGGACILIGIGRAVEIHLSEPIDADSVVVGDQ